PAAAACEEPIRVVSYNVRGLTLVTPERNADVREKIDTLYDAFSRTPDMPDILCLQEASRAEAFARRFGLRETYHAPRSTLWLFTRYPIRAKGSIDGAESSPSALWADLETPQGMLRVYNIHLVSNRVTNTTQELIDDFDKPGENVWVNFKFIISRY